MKVVYVSTIERGGPLTHLRQLAPRSPRPGLDVARALRQRAGGGDASARSDVAARPCPSRTSSTCAAAPALWPLLDGADLVHTHDRRAGLLGRLAGRLRGAARRPYAARDARGDRREDRPARRAGPAGRLRGAARLARARLPADRGRADAARARRRALAGDGRLPARARLPATAAPRDPVRDRARGAGRPRRRRSRRPRRRRRGEPRVLEGDRRAARGGRARRARRCGSRSSATARCATSSSGRRARPASTRASTASSRTCAPGSLELDVLVQPSRARQPAALDPRGDGGRPAGRRHARRRDPGARRRRRDGPARRARRPGGARRGARRSSPSDPERRARARRRRRGRAAERFSADGVARADGRALRGAVRDPPRDPGARHRRRRAGPALGRTAGARAAGHEVVRRGRARAARRASSTAEPSRCRSSAAAVARSGRGAAPCAARSARARPDVVHAHNPDDGGRSPGSRRSAGRAAARARERPRRAGGGLAGDGAPAAARRACPPSRAGPASRPRSRSTGSRRSRRSRTPSGPPRRPPTAARARCSSPATRLVARGRAAGRAEEPRARDRARSPQVPDATLAIVGDGPLRPKLERLAAELGVADRVVLPGVRPRRARADGRGRRRRDAVALGGPAARGARGARLRARRSSRPTCAASRELVADGENALLVARGRRTRSPPRCAACSTTASSPRASARRAGRSRARAPTSSWWRAYLDAVREAGAREGLGRDARPSTRRRRSAPRSRRRSGRPTATSRWWSSTTARRDATAAIAAAFPEPVRVVAPGERGRRGRAQPRDRRGARRADRLLRRRRRPPPAATSRRSSTTFDRNGGGIATSNCYWLFPDGIHPSRTRYKGRFPRPERQRLAILEQNFVSTMSLFPKALVDEIGPFDAELAVAEDWDFWLRAIYAGHRVALQPRPLALYRWGVARASRPRRRGWTSTRRPSSAGRRARRPDRGGARRTWSGGSPAPARPRSAATATRRSARSATARRPRATRAPPASAPSERAPALEGARDAPRAVADRPARARAAAAGSSGASASARSTSGERRRLRVAFVCTGNRFRSPLAAALLESETDGLPVEIASLGMLDLGDEPALPEAVALAEELGLDLTSHRARSVGELELGAFDLVLGFERKHVVASVVDAKAKIERDVHAPGAARAAATGSRGRRCPREPAERARVRIRQAHAARPHGFRNAPLPELRDPLGLSPAEQRETARRAGRPGHRAGGRPVRLASQRSSVSAAVPARPPCSSIHSSSRR